MSPILSAASAAPWASECSMESTWFAALLMAALCASRFCAISSPACSASWAAVRSSSRECSASFRRFSSCSRYFCPDSDFQDSLRILLVRLQSSSRVPACFMSSSWYSFPFCRISCAPALSPAAISLAALAPNPMSPAARRMSVGFGGAGAGDGAGAGAGATVGGATVLSLVLRSNL